MEKMEFQANLVWWVEGFMEQRKVIVSMDIKEADIMAVEPEVPPGSPVSQVHLIIYIYDLFYEIEEPDMMGDSACISFVDDGAWVV